LRRPVRGDSLGVVLREVLSGLVDLVLPSECAGCGSAFKEVCDACADGLAGPPASTRPTPAPPGLPRCLALGAYEDPLRALILAYKERGRRRLAAPLGDALATVIRTGAPPGRPLVLVPVPATAAARRARHGDHMLRLAHRAARRLRRDGWAVAVACPLRALPKQDSAHLDRHARARAAVGAFTARRGDTRIRAGEVVVVLDDVVTTGATLAAATTRLTECGVAVAFAATLAATRLRRVSSLTPNGRFPWDGYWDWG
jgi:predicted amidophosphoribosyltransferase